MAIDSKDLLVAIKAFSRANPLPLDASEVHESYEAALVYAASAKAYPGQMIQVMVDGEYTPYVLNGTEAPYSLTPVSMSNVRHYVQVVEALPEIGQEQGAIYIVSDTNTGYIWNGTEYVVIFESIEELKETVYTLETEVNTIREVVTELTTVTERVEVKIDTEEAKARFNEKKYVLENTPKGTIVNYHDKEIRVMCPENTVWEKQNVGPTGNSNMYYMAFKAYAPEGAVSFKEDDKETIEDQTMYYFEDNAFAGIDEFGRKYSVSWLALASYDSASDTWTYFGKTSSTDKYIGWYYSVEWYDADGYILESDLIRISLANDSCFSAIEPFYLANLKKEITNLTEEQITQAIEELVEVPVMEF